MEWGETKTVHKRAHVTALECFCLMPSTGSSFHAKAHSASQGAERRKPFCLWLHITRGADKTVGSNEATDERVPCGGKMTSTSRSVARKVPPP